MEYVILVDKKPEKCKTCFFNAQGIDIDEGEIKSVYDYCVLTKFKDPVEFCPLQEVNLIKIQENSTEEH